SAEERAGGPGDDLPDVPGEGPGPALPDGGGVGRGLAPVRQPLRHRGPTGRALAAVTEVGAAPTGRGGEPGVALPRGRLSTCLGLLGPTRAATTSDRAGASPLAASGRKDSSCVSGCEQR